MLSHGRWFFVVCLAVASSVRGQESRPLPTTAPTSAPVTSSQAASAKGPAYEWLGKGLDRAIEIKDDGLERLKALIAADRDKLQTDPTLKPEAIQKLTDCLDAQLLQIENTAYKLVRIATLPQAAEDIQKSIDEWARQVAELNQVLANDREPVWQRGLLDDLRLGEELRAAQARLAELQSQARNLRDDEIPKAEKDRKEWQVVRIDQARAKLEATQKERIEAEAETRRAMQEEQRPVVLEKLEEAVLLRLREIYHRTDIDLLQAKQKQTLTLIQDELAGHLELLNLSIKKEEAVVRLIDKEVKRVADEALARAQNDRLWWVGERERAADHLIPYIDEKLHEFEVKAALAAWVKKDESWRALWRAGGAVLAAQEDIERIEKRIANTDSDDIDVDERLPDDTGSLRKLVVEAESRRVLLETTRRDLSALLGEVRTDQNRAEKDLAEIDGRLSAAEQKQRQLIAGRDVVGAKTAADWVALRKNIKDALRQKKDLLEQLRDSVRTWDKETEPLVARSRENTRLLARRLLWTREKTDVSTASVRLAWDDLTRLEDGLGAYFSRRGREMVDHVKKPENRRSLVVGLVLLVVLLGIGRVIHRHMPRTYSWMENHGKGQLGRFAHIIATVLRRTEVAFLLAAGLCAVPAVIGFPKTITVPLMALFVAPFAYRFLRVLLDVLLDPESPDRLIKLANDDLTRLLYRAGQYELNVAAAFVPIGLWLEHGGYDRGNPGFVQLYWLVFRTLFHGVLLVTIFRPAVIVHLIRGKGEWAVTVKTLVVLCYPIVVGAVLGLFVLGSLRYQEAEQHFRKLALQSTSVLIGAYLIYLLVMRRVFPNREYSAALSPDEFPDAKALEDEGRKRYFNRLQRFFVRAVVFLPALVMIVRLWPPIPEAVMAKALFGTSGGVTPRDFLMATAAIVITWVGHGHFRDIMRYLVMPQIGIDQGLRYTVLTLTSYAILAVGFIVTLNILRVEGDQIAWFVSALAVGIGFGLQSIVKNFVSGLILLVERPLNVGDTVVVEGQTGAVDKITMRATTVITGDGKAIIIPNEKMIDSPMINESLGPPRLRSSINFGVAYGSDTKVVRKTALDVTKEHGLVLKRPEPEVFFTGFGESTLDFEIRLWTLMETHRGRVASDIRFALDAACRRMNVTMAFPARELYIKSIDPSVVDVLKSTRQEPEKAPSSVAPGAEGWTDTP